MESVNPYANWGTTAAHAQADERTTFIRKTYLHLTGAVMAFMAIEAALLTLVPREMIVSYFSMRFAPLLLMGAFIAVSFFANRWAQSDQSVGTQYLGLGAYVVAEAVIFLPLLTIATMVGENVIPTAGLLTMIVFGGLTVGVFMTGADFSFLRAGLYWAGFAALGLALCGAIFGFGLGLWFAVAMVVMASGYILYDTSNVLHHYRTDQYVAASLALFSSVALLFWYIVRIVMSLQSRD